ncbi:hypothetical protein D3C81_1194170 [compost metagenome]
MDEIVTVVLQVNTFGSRIGRQQDTHRRNIRSRLESGFDYLSVVVIHPTVQSH